MDINFEWYKIFYYAARHLSFSEAAKRLFISQSAVSQSIKNLEDKTGYRLFYRKGNRIVLTPEGEILFNYIEQAFNFIKAGESHLTEIKNINFGTVRIGAGDTICRYFVVPYIKKFIETYPNIRFQIINRTSDQIIDILKKGMIDFGIVTLPVTEKDLKATEFRKVEDVFVASSKFSHLRNRKVPLHELCSQPLLMLKKESSTRRNLDRFFQQHGLEIKAEIELESIELLIELAKIGLGISHVLRESVKKEIETGSLFVVETEYQLPVRSLGIITERNQFISPASKKFIDLLV